MIAAKDMKMPKYCIQCPVFDGGYDLCNIIGDEPEADLAKERPEDCPLVEIVTCKDCKHWKDRDGVFRRGIGAESKCPINTKEVFEGNFYCALGERRK